VKLAKETVESYIREGKTLEPEDLTPEMEEKAGVFVSIHKLGTLRGCIGTFEPAEENVARETISNAISSATRDPRFLPVTPEELQAGWRRGLLLPDLEGVDTVDYQIDICRQKAGIAPDEPVNLYRFEVKRHD